MTAATRLCTVRTADGAQWAEQDARGVLWLKGKDSSCEWGFPASVLDVTDFFKDNGREFDVARLPKPVIANPYGAWI